MEKKRVSTENSLHQEQVFGIGEYGDHVELCAYLSPEVSHVDIPDRLIGKPVTAIGEDCFFNCTEIEEVNFPETITSIGAQAFALCKSITELIFPDSIMEIGPLAFRDCRGLKKVIFPKHLKRLSTGLFSFCYLRDPEIILPEELEVIEENAFYSAGVFDLKIPDSVRKIERGAFCRGPKPVTRLPYDKGWDLIWPYGEEVLCDGVKSRITDLQHLEENCCLHEITLDSKTQTAFYPCDYLDGKIAFTEEKNEKSFQHDVRHIWGTEEELAKAYKIRDAWKKGMIGPR